MRRDWACVFEGFGFAAYRLVSFVLRQSNTKFLGYFFFFLLSGSLIDHRGDSSGGDSLASGVAAFTHQLEQRVRACRKTINHSRKLGRRRSRRGRRLLAAPNIRPCKRERVARIQFRLVSMKLVPHQSKRRCGQSGRSLRFHAQIG